MKKLIVFIMALAFGFALIGQFQFASEANTTPDTPAYRLVGSLYKV